MKDPNGVTVLGEMAHIIADKANGPRGDRTVSAEFLSSYENLILLCLDHHKLIDDNPSTYTVEELRSLKARHEAWVETLDGIEGRHAGVSTSYAIFSGDAGLRELRLGRQSEVLGPFGYDFNLQYDATFRWALRLQELCSPWTTHPPRLDWEALRALGAPIEPLNPPFEFREELAARGVDPRRVIKTEFTWVQLGHNNCPGIDPVEELASLDPRLGSKASQWSAELRRWIVRTVETTVEYEEQYALLPIITLREPLFYCLRIDAKEHAGRSLHLFEQGKHVRAVVLDGRPILIPIGCIFEDPDEEKWRIDGLECAMLERDDVLSDVELSTSLVYSDKGFLQENIIGPRLLVNSFEIRGADGAVVERGDIRPPYKVREYICCWFYGGSCPEIFCRVNTARGWKYIGPALRGAIGPARARTETVLSRMSGAVTKSSFWSWKSRERSPSSRRR